MAANVEAMVREGINAFKTGRKDEARALLLKATELDQYNEQAWLWLSGLMDTPEDQRTCLENVLAINPENERAKQGLSYLTGQTSAGNVSPFSAATNGPPSAPSPSAPTSVEWGAPDAATTPPAWNAPPPVEPSPDVLDDWVSNLNLPGGDLAPEADVFGDLSANSGDAPSPFGSFEIDEDAFAGGPFSADPMEGIDSGLDDSPPRTAASNNMGRTSPTPTPSRRSARASRRRKADSIIDDIDEDQDGVYLEDGEGELFGYIPPEIAPTRLPGTHERTPLLLNLAMIVLILLNIGVGSYVIFSLLT